MGDIQHPSAPAAPPAAIARVLARFDRTEIAGFIEVAIGLLDVADGDPDLEDDDPAGDPIEMHGEMNDGPLYKTLPIYGLDQSKGPTNERAAHRAHTKAILEEGAAWWRDRDARRNSE